MSAKFLLKKLVPFLLISVVFSTSSWAQGQPGVVAPPQGTPMVSGTPFQSVNNACDKYGVCNFAVTGSGGGGTQSVIPVSNATGLNGVGTINSGYFKVGNDTAEAGSTTTVINATTHAARVGDAIQITQSGSNLKAWSTVSAVTANTITVANAFPATISTSDAFMILRPVPIQASSDSAENVFLKVGGYNEDAAAATGDALVGVAGVINNAATTKAADGDYTHPSLSSSGVALASLVVDPNITNALQAQRAEDSVAASGDAGVPAFGVVRSALVAPAASADYSNIQLDESGRTITTLAPAGETWQGCGTATATTANTTIKAAVASNRIYVTAVNCASSDADNATNINFKDNTTVIAVGGVNQMATTSAGTFVANFNPPLRGTSNTDFNFNTAVSTSSVICCASGYISVN